MKVANILLWLVAAGFGVLSAEVLWEFGYWGFVDWALHNNATRLLFLDLVICLVLLTGVMQAHARKRGLTTWPYIALSAAFGAAGPLLYFARHLNTPESPPAGR
jgi:hypothetical protein